MLKKIKKQSEAGMEPAFRNLCQPCWISKKNPALKRFCQPAQKVWKRFYTLAKSTLWNHVSLFHKLHQRLLSRWIRPLLQSFIQIRCPRCFCYKNGLESCA